MRTKSTLFFLFCISLFCRADEIALDHYQDQNAEIQANTEVHLTAKSNAIVNSTVNLKDETSWLYFDNIRPAVVVADYQSQIFINGEALDPGVNARVSIYKYGTVIIPHTPGYQPLEVFTEKGFSGNSMKIGLSVYNKNLGDFNNAIKSFKLKKGYMATFANNADGTGYSRVYIADKEDLLVEELPKLLNGTVSFIRTFAWDWVTKKGWCGGDPALSDMLDCTWYYSWSADKNSTLSHEYVPIRQTRDWPSWSEINANNTATHLLGYNEPDHTEQHGGEIIPVDYAIAEWPKMMESGLRLGSPATTDFNWLYEFIRKCDSLNYRVDYVAIHAYWNSKSPANWYKDLKTVYEKTGRPIWITEWNNGANWTHEWWPDGVAEQQQKQLTDIKGIMQVLDTASFVERYSIYNWVEDKRAMILNGQMTPAGEFYKANLSGMAFNRNKEVIPHWNILNANLSLNLSSENNDPLLSWIDPNEGLTGKYQIIRQEDDNPAEIKTELDASQSKYEDLDVMGRVGKISYQVSLFPADGSSVMYSNVVTYFLSSVNSNLQYGQTSASDNNWYFHKLRQNYDQIPTVLFGTPSNNSMSPMSMRVKSLSAKNFLFHFDTWKYIEGSTFSKQEKIAYTVLPEGSYDLGGIKLQTGTVKSVSAGWKKVAFAQPFDVVPVVFTTQTTERSDYATTIAVRNVTKEGFEVSQQKERTQNDITTVTPNTNICYWAATPGSALLNGQKINVGVTAENAVGGIYSSKKIEFNETISNPLVFCGMQTSNDSIASTLKYNSLTDKSVNIFKQRENSKGGNPNSAVGETVGWMVLENSNLSSIAVNEAESLYRIYPNPAKDIVNISGIYGDPLKVVVYDLAGKKVLEQMVSGQINVASLAKGCYILNINNAVKIKLIKE